MPLLRLVSAFVSSKVCLYFEAGSSFPGRSEIQSPPKALGEEAEGE